MNWWNSPYDTYNSVNVLSPVYLSEPTYRGSVEELFKHVPKVGFREYERKLGEAAANRAAPTDPKWFGDDNWRYYWDFLPNGDVHLTRRDTVGQSTTHPQYEGLWKG